MLYASRARIDGPVYPELERIRAAALRHNQPLGVYTALLYQSGWFLQWKEGPTDAMRAIMGRMVMDRRHHSLRVVHSSRGPRLLHGPWSMAIVQSDEAPETLGVRVMQLREALIQGRQYSPSSVWRRLSNPARHGADGLVEPEAYQRVLMCAAQGTGSFDFVRWLAARYREPVVQRRFAGATGLDVGTDYLDIEHEQRLLRLVAMARRGLDLPLTRALLAEYSHVVLLLCREVERNQAVLERVVRACKALPLLPAVVGVGTDGGAHAALALLARRLAIGYQPAPAAADEPAGAWSALQPVLKGWRARVPAPLPVEPVPW